VATAEENAKYDARLGAMAARIAQAVAGQPLVKFTAYELDADDLPRDNLDEIAFSGRCKFVQPAGLWRQKAYESDVVLNPTWLDIAKLANDMISVTGDDHHVYLEGIGHVRDEADITVLGFVMGS